MQKNIIKAMLFLCSICIPCSPGTFNKDSDTDSSHEFSDALENIRFDIELDDFLTEFDSELENHYSFYEDNSSLSDSDGTTHMSSFNINKQETHFSGNLTPQKELNKKKYYRHKKKQNSLNKKYGRYISQLIKLFKRTGMANGTYSRLIDSICLALNQIEQDATLITQKNIEQIIYMGFPHVKNTEVLMIPRGKKEPSSHHEATQCVFFTIIETYKWLLNKHKKESYKNRKLFSGNS